VAARLFDGPLLRSHLDDLGRLVERVPVLRLGYPHRRDVIPAVREAILAAFASREGDDLAG
jgi:hypothetical protein